MSKRILVLDDDPDILDVISFILEDAGYEIKTLLAGEQIFDHIRDFNPNLVLMDVMLAKMDGRVICRDLKTTPGTDQIPVILISGTHDIADSLKKHGAPNDFIAKPFDLNVLLQRIEQHLS